VPYYLALIYLEDDRRPEAIAEWREYVRMDPKGEDALKIRKYLTLLIQREAIEYAKEALANESALLKGPAARNTVAVTPFKNLGSEKLGRLGKGLATMLIYDLSQVPGLQVVERQRVQALLQEMHLDASGLVAPGTAPRIGKLLKSRHIATGSLADQNEEELRIVSAVADTEHKGRIHTRETEGALDKFYKLEKGIACAIITDLGRDCSKMPAAFKKIHTKSIAAMTAFSLGLDYLDQEKYENARAQFRKAIKEDPDFDLAKGALLATPTAALSRMNTQQMVLTLSLNSGAFGMVAPSWQTVYQALLDQGKGGGSPAAPGKTTALAYTPPDALVLNAAVSLALMKNAPERACKCMKMALDRGYNPYLVLKIIYGEGGDPGFNRLAKCAIQAQVMKAIIAKAAIDAVTPLGQPVFNANTIAQSKILQNHHGLPYTAEQKGLENIPIDTDKADNYASHFTP
jgi:TolB-like protein